MTGHNTKINQAVEKFMHLIFKAFVVNIKWLFTQALNILPQLSGDELKLQISAYASKCVSLSEVFPSERDNQSKL